MPYLRALKCVQAITPIGTQIVDLYRAEAIVEGLPVRFNVQPSRRHEGKTEASDIEIVISEAA